MNVPPLTRCLLIATVGLALATSAVARDGDPDQAFGERGSLVLRFPGNHPVIDSFTDIAVLDDGKLLVGVTVDIGGIAATDMGVMRLHRDGTIDTSFGVDGGQLVGFDQPNSDHNDYFRDLFVQPDGKIVLVGDAAGGVGGNDMAVARLLPDGTPDSDFGVDGRTVIAFDLGASPALRIDIGVRGYAAPDGTLLIGGQVTTSTGSVMGIARLTPAGQLDPGFDGDGRRTLDFGGNVSDNSVAFRLQPTADGLGILAFGAASRGGNLDYAAARLRLDGTPDPAFAGDGTTTFGFDLGGSFADVATDGLELPDGRLLLCGTTPVDQLRNSDFACMRFLANGQPDGSFPPVLIPFDLDADGDDNPYAIVRDTRGRIVIAGFASIGMGSYNAAVVRLLPSGQVDPAFGDDGRRHYSSQVEAGTDLINRAYSVAIQDDGKIVTAGAAAVGADTNYVQIIRLIGDTLLEDGFDDR